MASSQLDLSTVELANSPITIEINNVMGQTKIISPKVPYQIRSKVVLGEVKIKNQTYHYLPYNFGGSGSSNFEKEILQATINLKTFQDNKLEIYYNGERGLTEFVVDCFYKVGKQWKNAGKYTTDFLIIKRNIDKSIHKILLLETKGGIYANDEVFKRKKRYIETEFLRLNQDKFNYKRFDFLYLETTQANPKVIINQKITTFFKD
jgi:hypothetical protein